MRIVIQVEGNAEQARGAIGDDFELPAELEVLNAAARQAADAFGYDPACGAFRLRSSATGRLVGTVTFEN